MPVRTPSVAGAGEVGEVGDVGRLGAPGAWRGTSVVLMASLSSFEEQLVHRVPGGRGRRLGEPPAAIEQDRGRSVVGLARGERAEQGDRLLEGAREVALERRLVRPRE